MTNKREFLLYDAAEYVEKLEKELTPAAAQNAYHGMVRLFNTGALPADLKSRYESACDKVNERFPA